MREQIPYREKVPGGYEAMRSLEQFLAGGRLDRTLLEFVRLRVSQINGCAYCVDLHSTRLQSESVPERKIFAVASWFESSFFTNRECAALTVAEELTANFDEPIARDRFEVAYDVFTEEELVELVVAVIAINGWNRLWVLFRTPEIESLSTDEPANE